MSAHTPGPWDPEWWGFIVRGLHNLDWTHDEHAQRFNYPGFAANSTDVADGHLIAAAPDLLEAVQHARHVIGPCKILDAAIAKAMRQ